MDNQIKNKARRIFTAMIALTMMTGVLPCTPLSVVIGNTAITANAQYADTLSGQSPENNAVTGAAKNSNGINRSVYDYGEAYNRLTDNQKEIYRMLFSFAQSVVNGEQTSSVFTYTPEFAYTWTAETLGLPQTATYQDGFKAVQEKIKALFPYYNSEDMSAVMSAVMNALLKDCPYEFYWFVPRVDNAFSYSMESPDMKASISGGKWTITLSSQPKFTVTMQVSLHYQDGSTTTIDTDKINAVKNSVPVSAQTIIDRYANDPDYDKLCGYAKALCSLTGYNDDARDGRVSAYDSDPWQLVYVFDNDNDTMVVCEGYSKAFKYLCDKTVFNSELIKCYLVTGTLSSGNNDGGRHMWNVVTMDDGLNYLVDVTNSDECTGRTHTSFLLNGGTLNGSWYQVKNRNYDGDYLYFLYDEETKTLWGDDILTLSSSDYEKQPNNVIKGASLTLKGDVGVNLYFRTAYDLPAGSYVAVKGPNDTAPVHYPVSGLEITDGFRKVSCPVYATQMNEDVTFELYDNNGQKINWYLENGDECETYKYSVSDYINTVNNDTSQPQELRDLTSAMKNYGDWSKAYFSNDAAAGTPAEITDVNTDDLKLYAITKSDDYHVEGLSFSLILDSTVSLKLYYTGDEETITVSDGAKFMTGKSNNKNYVEIQDISAKDLNKVFKVTFGNKGYVNVSALSYAYNILKAYSDNAEKNNICNTVKALFKYNVAAKAFFD